jgi:pilus assembly protein CpaE
MAELILIVDDDVQTIKFLKLMLERQGYETLSADNGMLALEIVNRAHPDLIILDVMMPGVDGFEVARSIRRNPETSLTPILMFTAKTMLNDKLSGYNAGVDIYLTKPIHPVELNANVKALLAQRRARLESSAQKGYTIGLVSARGGTGVSTVALNLAVSYAQKQETNVIAAELKPGHGSWAIDLNLTNNAGLCHLIKKPVSEITQSAVEEQLIPMGPSIRLLLASNASEDVLLVSSIAQYESLVEVMGYMAPLIVLDIGTNFIPAFEVIANSCNEIILLVEPQPTAVKHTYQLADQLRKKHFGSSKALTIVTVNRSRSDLSLSMSQIEKILGQAVAMGIPPAAEQAYRASELGVPLIQLQPEGIVAQQFHLLTGQIAQRVQA